MSNIDLNQLRDRAYQCALDHGFHEQELSNEHFLMLVITEFSEAIEADRMDKRADKFGFDVALANAHQGVVRPDWFQYAYNRCIKGSVEEELADAVIRLLDLAGLRNISLDSAQKDLSEGYVNEMADACKDETFTESVYAILSLPIKYKTIYDFSIIINDSIVSLFGLAEYTGIDLLWHIEQKMQYNELRENKHEKKY